MSEESLFCDIVHCRVCNKTMRNCWCSPIPCPFCNAEFGFVQDWNVHLIKEHEKESQSNTSEMQK